MIFNFKYIYFFFGIIKGGNQGCDCKSGIGEKKCNTRQ